MTVRPSRKLKAALVAGATILLLALCANVAAGQQDDRLKNAAKIFQGAERDLEAGLYAAAESGFREVLRLDPRAAAAYANLGVVYLRTNRLQAAIESLDQAAQLAPGVPGIQLNLGLAYLRQERFGEAVPHFRQALNLDASQTQARYLLGLSYFMLDDQENAARTLDPLYPQFSSQLDYLFMLGSSHGRAGREEEAARIFGEMLKVGGDSPRIHWFIGNAYLAAQVNQKAIEELEKARADPKLPYVHYSLALAYYRVRRVEEAGKELKQEIEVNPGFSSAYGLQGSVYLDLRQLDKAIANYEKALQLEPNQAAVFYGLGRVYMLKGNISEAIKHLERAALLKPDNDSIHFQLGQAYRKVGRKEEAEKELARAQKFQAAQRDMLERRILGELPPSPVQAPPSAR